MRRIAPVAAFGIGWLLAAGTAAAHGREPIAVAAAVDPDDRAHLAVLVSHGLFESWDGGASWRWICTDAYGATVTEDPSLAIDADGGIVIGTRHGMVRSGDGCGFADVDLGPATGAPVMAMARGADDRLVVVSAGASTLLAGDGITFAAVGRAFPDALAVPTSVVLDARGRAWLGTRRADAAVGVAMLERDEGWAPLEVPLERGERRLDVLAAGDGRALAVARRDERSTEPERLLWVGDDGGVDDAGALEGVRGGVIDGSAAWVVGLGGALAGSVGGTLAPSPVGAGTCAARDGVGALLVCGRPFDDGFLLARADGDRARTMLEPDDVAEPFACPAGHPTNALCGGAWDDLVIDLSLDPRLLGQGATPPPAGCAAGIPAGRGGFAWLVALGLVLRRRRRAALRRGRATTPGAHRAAAPR